MICFFTIVMLGQHIGRSGFESQLNDKERVTNFEYF